MKRIDAIFPPYKLVAVREAIEHTGMQGMTVQEVRGYSRRGVRTESQFGIGRVVNFVPKVRVLVYAPDGMVDTIVSEITKAAIAEGDRDGGSIFISSVSKAIHIRTGATGDEAL